MANLLVAVRLAFIGFSLLAFFYVCGAGLTKLLLPDRLKSNEILLAPVVGVAVFIVLAYALSFAGLRASIWIWLIAAIVFVIYIAAGFARGWQTGFVAREHLFPLLLVAGVFAAGVAPLVNVGYLTNLGTTGDVINYCLPADYLLNHGLRTAASIPPTTPLNAICHTWFQLGARLGTNLVVAGTDTLFGLESYQTFFPLINLLMSMTILSVWVLCRNGLRVSRAASRVAIVAVALSNLMYWASVDGFLAQQLVLCLIPGIIVVGFAFIDTPDTKAAVLAAILLSPLFASYEFALMYPAGILAIWFLITLIRRRTLKPYLLPLAAGGGSLILLNIFVFIRRGFSLKDSAGSPEFASALSRSMSGNIRYYTPLNEMLGLNVHQHARTLPVEGLAALPHYSLIIAVLTAAIIIMAFIGLYRTDFETRWKIVALGLPFVGVGLVLRYLTFPYGYYKNIALAAPFAMIAIGLAAAILIGPPQGRARAVRPWIRAAAIIIMIGFFGLNLYSLAVNQAYVFYKINQANSEIITPSQDVIDLRSRLPVRPGKLMIGANVPDTQQLWMLYFLRDNRLSLEKPSVYLTSWGDRFTEKSLADAAIYSAGYDVNADIRWQKNPAWRNAGYLLYARDSNLLAALTGPKGEAIDLNPGERLAVAWQDNKVKAGTFKPAAVRAEAANVRIKIWTLSPAAANLTITGAGGTFAWPIASGFSSTAPTALRKDTELAIINNGKTPVIVLRLAVYK